MLLDDRGDEDGIDVERKRPLPRTPKAKEMVSEEQHLKSFVAEYKDFAKNVDRR